MPRTLTLSIILVLFAFVCPVSGEGEFDFPQCPQPGYVADCTVQRVIDGDTLIVEVKHSIRIRLLHCWAPESRTKDLEEKKRGLAAKQHLVTVAYPGAEGIVFIPAGYDLSQSQTLNRMLGYVWIKGEQKSVNEQQIDGGFGYLQKPDK